MFGSFAKKNSVDGARTISPRSPTSCRWDISCRVTYQVRVCFGSWKVYPFDWWITPLAGLSRYLAAPDIGKLYACRCAARDSSPTGR